MLLSMWMIAGPAIAVGKLVAEEIFIGGAEQLPLLGRALIDERVRDDIDLAPGKVFRDLGAPDRLLEIGS